jgi:hypothetical protein
MNRALADTAPRGTSRTWLLALVLLAVAAELLLVLAFRPYRGSDIVKLELASSAAEFSATVQRDWTQDAASTPAGAEPLCGLGLPHLDVLQQATPRPRWGKLRCNLVADSLALVPGYVGLLVVLTLGLVPAGALRWQRLVWTTAALLAGAADLLENGLTLWALDAWHQNMLSDALVANVRGASQAKWLLLAVALAVLGHVAWHHAAQAGKVMRKLAAGLCVLGALALPLGAWWWRPGIAIGMAAMVLALGMLAWRQWKLPPV